MTTNRRDAFIRDATQTAVTIEVLLEGKSTAVAIGALIAILSKLLDAKKEDAPGTVRGVLYGLKMIGADLLAAVDRGWASAPVDEVFRSTN